MTSRLIVTAAAFAALAACQDEPAGKDSREMTAEEVAAELASVEIEPGQWDYVAEIVSVDGPIPQPVRQQIAGQRTEVSNCITPQQAERPSANFLAALEDSQCSYRDFDMQGTRVTGTMTCTGGQMGDKEVELAGNYGSESYDMAMRIESSALPGIEIKARARGERVGDCA